MNSEFTEGFAAHRAGRKRSHAFKTKTGINGVKKLLKTMLQIGHTF